MRSNEIERVIQALSADTGVQRLSGNERVAFVLEVSAALRSAVSTPAEGLESQVARLARFIMDHIPGEPSRSEGAIDCAIRLLARSTTHAEGRGEEAVRWAVARSDGTLNGPAHDNEHDARARVVRLNAETGEHAELVVKNQPYRVVPLYARSLPPGDGGGKERREFYEASVELHAAQRALTQIRDHDDVYSVKHHQAKEREDAARKAWHAKYDALLAAERAKGGDRAAESV